MRRDTALRRQKAPTCEHADVGCKYAMGIGITAISIFSAAIMVVCRVRSVSWTRTALAVILGSLSLYLSFGIALELRTQHLMKVSPHDGQSAMDVLAFAILVASAASTLVVLFFLWSTRIRKAT